MIFLEYLRAHPSQNTGYADTLTETGKILISCKVA